MQHFLFSNGHGLNKYASMYHMIPYDAHALPLTETAFSTDFTGFTFFSPTRQYFRVVKNRRKLKGIV